MYRKRLTINSHVSIVRQFDSVALYRPVRNMSFLDARCQNDFNLYELFSLNRNEISHVTNHLTDMWRVSRASQMFKNSLNRLYLIHFVSYSKKGHLVFVCLAYNVRKEEFRGIFLFLKGFWNHFGSHRILSCCVCESSYCARTAFSGLEITANQRKLIKIFASCKE